jgi:hypothetical protein
MIRLAIFSLVLLLCQSQSFAGIFLPALASPDILSNQLSSTFTVSDQRFQVNGMSSRFNGLSINGHPSATTKIDAVLGGSLGVGLFELTGTIEIKGRQIPGNNSSPIVTLLQGTLRGLKAAFNFTGTRDSFEFHFYVTGGELRSQFGNTARTLAFLNGSNTASDFSSDFFHNVSLQNQADTNPTVPESSSAVVWLALGCVALIVGSRRRLSPLPSLSFV